MATSQLCSNSSSVRAPHRRPFKAGTLSQSRTAVRIECQSSRAASFGTQIPQKQGEDTSSVSRRKALLFLSAPLLLLGKVQPALAEPLRLSTYEDGPDEFRLLVPEGWTAGTGQAEGARFGGSTGARRALAWYPEGEIDSTNVTVIITNVGADFTKLGSFGTASAFGENLVASMDRRFLRRAAWGNDKEAIQEAELLAAREGKKGQQSLYYIDYTLLKPGEDEKRIFKTAVALGFNGIYNRLFTLTAQCKQRDFERVGDTLQQVVESFTPPASVI